jgi:cell division protein FtsL
MIFDMLLFFLIILFVVSVIGLIIVACKYKGVSSSEQKAIQELKRLNEMLDCFLNGIENSNKKEEDF